MEQPIDTEFELKFWGSDNVKPHLISSREVANIIGNFEGAVAQYIAAFNPQIKSEQVIISLVGIEESSLKLKFKPQFLALATTALINISAALNSNNFENLPRLTSQHLKPIQSFAKVHQCIAEISIDTEKLSQITPDTQIKVTERKLITGETTIYGQVVRVGGKEPKVQLVTDQGSELYLSVSKSLAGEIAKYLYKTIGLKGYAKWDDSDYKITDFQTQEILDFKEIDILGAFDLLKNEIGSVWDNISNIEEALLLEIEDNE